MRPLGQIVRRKLQCDAIARQYADTIAAEFARQVRKHGAFLVQLDAEPQAARKFFNNSTGYFNAYLSLLISLQSVISNAAPRWDNEINTRSANGLPLLAPLSVPASPQARRPDPSQAILG